MDASDYIKTLKDKTLFYFLQAQFSTALGNSNPSAGLTINNFYNFTSYEIRESYFNGRFEVGFDYNLSTCSTFCYQ